MANDLRERLGKLVEKLRNKSQSTILRSQVSLYRECADELEADLAIEPPAALGENTKAKCPHVNLVKQVGPMDGGAESTRYRCKECSAFLVATQLAAPQIATSAGGKATQLDQRRK
jgi:hypothetical protein